MTSAVTADRPKSAGNIFNASQYAVKNIIRKRAASLSVSVIGNCHRYNIALVLAAANPFLQVTCYPFNADHTQTHSELAKCDLVLATDFPKRKEYEFPRPEAVVFLPGTYFAGFHPDMLPLRLSSPEASFFGNMQSRIIVECYLRGYDRQKTRTAFNPDTYEALGYFNAMEPEIQRLAGHYAEWSFELNQFLPGWLRRGCFMYMIHHPRLYVFIDLVLDIMRRRQIPIINRVNLEDYVEDRLWGNPTWPVYPDLAARLGMPECGTTYFKMGKAALTLEEFIKVSYKSYEMVGLPAKRIQRVDF
jgi:hypothetical protein